VKRRRPALAAQALSLAWVLAVGGTLPTAASAADSNTAAPGATLRLASWNLEWLLTPATFSALKGHCSSDDDERRTNQRQLPCDVAAQLERSAIDISAMARYAKQLNGDIIALQEVDGAAAARQIFPDYEFCFTGSRAVQNTGFAIRRGVPYRCGADLMALSLGDRVRRGATVTLFPGTPRELQLLGVHLKSGCARQQLDQGPAACRLLAQQVPVLEGWIDSQARANARFAVLGDFNRILLAERGTARAADGQQRNIWAEINDGEPRGATLVNTAAGVAFRNCTAGQNYNGYIDLIVLGAELAQWQKPASFTRVLWDPRDAARYKLSDHCPIAIELKLP
jgi:endonuclease/exonuclease/phosphatase family metal-dependent hydrolase